VALVKFISDLVVLVGFGSSLISYNLDTKDVIITQHNGIIHLKGLGELNSIDLFGSSKLLVACDEGVVELHISDVAASKEGPFSTYKKHTAYTTCAKYRQAPQSEDLMIVSGGFDSKVLVYDQKKQIPTSFDFNDTSVLVESGNVKQMFNPPYVHSLVLLKDGSWAAAAAGNGSIELLQLDSQFRMQPLEAHGSAVVFVDIVASSPSSLVTAGNDGAIAFWDLNLPDESTATKFIELTTRRRGVAAKMKIAKAALAPQKKLLASLDSQIAALKDAPRATLLLKIDHSHKVNWIKSLRNGTMFVADTQDSITCYTVVL
jgi:WD40 repeat protein